MICLYFCNRICKLGLRLICREFFDLLCFLGLRMDLIEGINEIEKGHDVVDIMPLLLVL